MWQWPQQINNLSTLAIKDGDFFSEILCDGIVMANDTHQVVQLASWNHHTVFSVCRFNG